MRSDSLLQRSRVARILAVLRRHPSALLLFVQLLGVVLYPAMENTPVGRTLFGVFGIVVLALALRVINQSPVLNWVAWSLALPAVALAIASVVVGDDRLLTWAQLLESALYFYTAFGLTVYMLEDDHVSGDELFAAGATFTVLAWAFAFAFCVCQSWYPGSFTAGLNPTDPRSWMEVLFLSFSVLSGVGLSDVIPLLPQARALVMLEQFAGVMYIALVVSRLIGLATSRAVARHDHERDRDRPH